MGWVLLNNGTRQKLRLRPGTVLVGRAQNAQLRPNHQSVSRAHAEIVVELPPGDLLDAKQYPIFLIDNSSTGHTFVNTKPSAGKGVRMPLAHGDTLAFGVDPVNFSLQWTPTVLSCSSRMTPAENEHMKALSRKAGVFLTQEWTSSCTHLLMDRLSITPKLLCCTVDGGVPVAASFLTALAEADVVCPVPDNVQHQPQPPVGPDAAYAAELEACVRAPKSKREFLRDVYVIYTAQHVSQALTKALTSAGVKEQLVCNTLQDVASIAETLNRCKQIHGTLAAEIWVTPSLEEELANALAGPLLAVGVQRCLSVPLEGIVRGMLLGTREAVHNAAAHIPLGKSSQGPWPETQQQQQFQRAGRGPVKASEVKATDVKMAAAVKEESFPQTQEHSVAPPSLRGSASEAPPTLTRKRDEVEANTRVAKRQFTSGRFETAKEQHSQEQKPAQSLAVGMAQTVSSFTRTKSEKAAMDAPYTVGSESGVKQDEKKLKVESKPLVAATLSSCGGPTPSVEGSGMPKILSINFDTPFTQPKPEDEKEELAKAPPKVEIKLKSEAPAPHSLGGVSNCASDGITMARSDPAPLAQQQSPPAYVPKVHPVDVWLPKAAKESQKQAPLIVNVQGIGEIDISVLRASVSKAVSEPMVFSRKGIGVGATEARNGRTSNGRRNFKLFRKSIGQQVQPHREFVPVAPWAPPAGPGLAEVFGSHRLESESQLPPVFS